MYTIRKATLNDIETIRHIARETYQHTYLSIIGQEQIDYMQREIYSVEKLSSQISESGQKFLILEDESGPVAFAGFSPRIEDPDVYKLHKLYCLPQTQGKGYGKILINEVAAQTLEAGKHLLDLNVNRHNKAKTFYEKMGFKVIYEEDIPIGKYFMNDFVMRKALTPATT